MVMDTRKNHGKPNGSLNRSDDHGQAADDDRGEHVQDWEDQVHSEQRIL